MRSPPILPPSSLNQNQKPNGTQAKNEKTVVVQREWMIEWMNEWMAVGAVFGPS